MDAAVNNAVKKAEKKAEKKGKIEGKIEREIEIAKNMIKKGFDDETIAEVTGLTIEQIQALREEMH
jgi:predicted transposase/invertase (TIGR01784 family)